MENQNNNKKTKLKSYSSKRVQALLITYAKNLSTLNGGSTPDLIHEQQVERIVSNKSILEKGTEQLDLVASFPIYLN